jgi:hypothetical protein
MKGQFIGGGLFLLGIGVLLYFFNDTPEQGQTVLYRGVLKQPAIFSHTGGDFKHHYAKFEFKGQSIIFRARDCGYYQMDVEKLKALKEGDSLFVLTDDVRPVFTDSPGEVVEIRSPRYGLILGFDDYSNCDGKQWTFSFYIGVVMIIIGLIQVIVSSDPD